jgi:hypothetical protein
VCVQLPSGDVFNVVVKPSTTVEELKERLSSCGWRCPHGKVLVLWLGSCILLSFQTMEGCGVEQGCTLVASLRDDDPVLSLLGLVHSSPLPFRYLGATAMDVDGQGTGAWPPSLFFTHIPCADASATRRGSRAGLVPA